MSNRTMNLDVLVRLKDRLTGPWKKMTALMKGLTDFARKFAVLGAAIAAISFMGPIREAAAFQQKLLDIAGTQNLAGKEAFAFFEQAKSRYQGLALEIGTYSDAIADAAGTMIAAGIDQSLVDASMRDIGRAAKAVNADIVDMAGVATSLLGTLKLPADQLSASLGGLIVAGKEGAFELKDMARYFPTLTSQMAKYGVVGREAVDFLGAALQIARKGTADPAEAANNLKNFLSKIGHQSTVKAFKDMNVDIQAVMQDAATKGINPIEAVMQKIVKLTGVSGGEIDKLMKKATANGLEGADALGFVREQLEAIHGAGKLGDLFADQQVMDFIIPFLANVDEFKRIKEAVAQATGGAIDADFETQMKSLNTQQTIFKELGEQVSREIGFAFGAWLPMINENLAAAVEWFRELDKETGGMVRKSLSLAGGVAVLGAAFGALSFVMPIVGSGLAILATPLTLLAGALTAISAPVWAAIAGVAALGAVAYRYWTPIKNFAQGVASQVGPALSKVGEKFVRFHVNLAKMAGKRLIDFGRWLGLDDATISSLVAGAHNLAQNVVDTFKALPGQIGQFLSDIFTFPDFSDADAAGFRTAGERAGRALIDGISGFVQRFRAIFSELGTTVSENWKMLASMSVDQLKDAGMKAGQAMVQAIKDAFGSLLEWFSGLGGRILSAIGEIDIGSLFKFNNVPSWMPDFLKADSPDAQLKETSRPIRWPALRNASRRRRPRRATTTLPSRNMAHWPRPADLPAPFRAKA